jgi:hypothetical protein
MKEKYFSLTFEVEGFSEASLHMNRVKKVAQSDKVTFREICHAIEEITSPAKEILQ